MKQVSLLMIGVFFTLLSVTAHAQSKTGADYFAGKWKILVKGTPDGDSKMVFVLSKGDTAFTGVVQDTTGADISKISKIILKDTVITVYFTAQGYDIDVILTKKSDDHVTGSLMSMFDVEGDRIKIK
jgi:uncharacterized protein YvpB